MRKFWRNPAANRLNDYWNVAWASTVPDGLPPGEFADPAQMDMIDRVHGLYHPERLDESVVTSLEIQLMNAYSTAYEISPALPAARPKRIVVRPTWLPQREEILPRKWSLAAVASVALVAITLAVFFFSFRQTDHPALVPGTPDDATPITVPAPTVAPVTMYRGNNDRTGEMPGPAPAGRPGVLWRIQAKDQVISAVTVANGLAYVGSNDGVIHAIDIATGTESWTFETGPDAGSPFTIIDGDTVYAVGGDGMAHALNAASGTEIWHSDPALLIGNQVTLDGDTLYVGGQDAQYFALNRADGSLRWTATLGGIPQSRATVVLNDTVYFGADDGKAYALDGATGLVTWTFDSGMEVIKSVSTADGLIFLPASNPSTAGAAMIAVSVDTGTEVWRYDNDGAYASSGTPLGTNLLVGMGNGELKSLNIATGAVNWTYDTGNGSEIGAGASIVDGIAYFVSIDYGLYAVDATTGQEVWRVQLDGSMNMSPAIIDGVIYVGTFAGGIYALGDGGTSLTSDATPIATPESAPVTSLSVGQGATPPVAEGPVTLLWQTEGTADRMPWQTGMTIAPDGNIWLSDAVNGQFLIYSPDGKLIEAWGSKGTANGQFNLHGPRGDGFGDVVFSADGSFYVLDPGNSRVQAFDKSRTFLRAWGTYGSGGSQFLDAIGIDLDTNGVIYVLDGQRGDVQKFSPEGTLLETVTLQAEFYGTNSLNSITVVIDGNMLISGNGDGVRPFEQFMKYDPRGNLLQKFRAMDGPAKLLDQVNTITLDVAGNIYVATERVDGRVVVFTAAGDYLTSFKLSEVSDVAIPFSVDVDNQGNIYVADGTTLRLAKFSLNPPLWPLESEATPTT